MGKLYDAIDDRLRAWILKQPMFFVGTAPLSSDGHVNISPKGMAGTFAVLGDRRVAYLDYFGSGAETIAHLHENGRIVLMFCAFDGPPKIVRLHGRGRTVLRDQAEFATLRGEFGKELTTGQRSVVVVDVDRIADSCGYAVPYYELKGERPTLTKWADNRGREGVEQYWAEHNVRSLNDKETGIL